MDSDLALRTSDRIEIVRAGTYISSKASRIHSSLGGTFELDLERASFLPFEPYLALEEALIRYIPKTLGIGIQRGDSWESLCERINQVEQRYTESKEGLWHSIWYKVGGNKDMLDGWVNLIPNEYGLAVVKTGVAVVFKLAEHSAEKRSKIFNTFAALRDALMRADPSRTSFRADPEVNECANLLYETVVTSIEDMILLTCTEKVTWRKLIPKIKQKPPHPNLDAILKDVNDSTEKFDIAVNSARDRTIESTAIMTEYTGLTATLVRNDVNTIKNSAEALSRQVHNVESIGHETHGLVARVASDLRYLRELSTTEANRKNAIAEREKAMESDQLNARNQMMHLLLENKRKDAEIAMLKEQTKHIRKRGAVVSVNRLCEIIAQPNADHGEPSDLEGAFGHPNHDLSRVIVHRGRFSMAIKGQVQSLLRHNRFLQFIRNRHLDLIHVDANLPSVGTVGLSATSVFCATLVTSIVNVQPETVLAHFFCGIHLSPRDNWHGPHGLVRSLIMQLLMKLVEMDLLDLSFINNRDYLIDLENHDLDTLCDAFYALISQFPPDTTICCITDSISCFDRDRTFSDLGTVMEWLQQIVNDKLMTPVFKVLMIDPRHRTRRFRELPIFQEDPSRLVNLSPTKFTPTEISPRIIENHLLRSSTPAGYTLPRHTAKSPVLNSYVDEYTGGWQSE